MTSTSDETDTKEEGPAPDAALTGTRAGTDGGAEPGTGTEAGHRSPSRLMIIAIGAAVLVLVGLVAFLRPGRHAEPAPAETKEAPDVVEPGADTATAIGFEEKEGACSRPAAGARIAALAQADSFYESGDFAKARDLYLDLLLTGGDLGGDGDAVVRWVHGRLALSLARIARGPAVGAVTGGGRLLDDPPLTFREPAR